MAMSVSEARKRLFPLIEQVNDDQEPVEIVSKADTAYLVPAEQWRSPAGSPTNTGSFTNSTTTN